MKRASAVFMAVGFVACALGFLMIVLRRILGASPVTYAVAGVIIVAAAILTWLLAKGSGRRTADITTILVSAAMSLAEFGGHMAGRFILVAALAAVFLALLASHGWKVRRVWRILDWLGSNFVEPEPEPRPSNAATITAIAAVLVGVIVVLAIPGLLV